MPTLHVRRLFIEETITDKTGSGTREVWEPTAEEMRGLGWERIPSRIIGVVEIGPDEENPPVMGVDGVDPLGTNGIVKPCPVHTELASTLCGSCVAWSERERAAE